MTACCDPDVIWAYMQNDAIYVPRDAPGHGIARAGSEFARDKVYINLCADQDLQPKYFFTYWQWKVMSYLQPQSDHPLPATLFRDMERSLEFDCDGLPRKVVTNHVIGTRYRNGNDNITPHKDKMVSAQQRITRRAQ